MLSDSPVTVTGWQVLSGKEAAITETDTRSCTSIDNDSWAAELLLHFHDFRLGLTGDRLQKILE